ncbi:hypothetical protein [Halorussus litoreus]|nr:hypothetical protein [Halorussus litoreus]
MTPSAIRDGGQQRQDEESSSDRLAVGGVGDAVARDRIADTASP